MGRITTRVAVALGSNLGDRRAYLRFAVEQLSALLADMRVSTFIESAPVDVAEPQPTYLNGVAVGHTTLTARDLLDTLLAIEREQGRTRLTPRAPRTLDLDLILYGDAIINEPGLEVPHPRFRERSFVLDPLKEIAPELVDPVTGKRIGEMSCD